MKSPQVSPRLSRMLFSVLVGVLTLAAVTTANTSAGATGQATAPTQRQPAVAPAALTQFELHFRNRTSSPVYVALMYRDYSGTCDNDGGWATRGWWTVPSGSRVHVLNTRNRYVYFYARSQNGTLWRGASRYMYVDNGRRFRSCQDIGTSTWTRVGVRTILMGTSFNAHTVNLNGS